ncbi:metal-binding protein [Halobacteriales archaeon QH_8_67_36]|nr:MAG: metal-binding protein [Halobacteriales archaeon QH_8_67_36]
MHKDELLELHEQMVTIMEFFRDEMDAVDPELFDPYGELDVRPSDVHKSKSEHKHAVFVLGNALATAMSEDEFSDAGRIGKRMEELAEDAESKL